MASGENPPDLRPTDKNPKKPNENNLNFSFSGLPLCLSCRRFATLFPLILSAQENTGFGLRQNIVDPVGFEPTTTQIKSPVF